MLHRFWKVQSARWARRDCSWSAPFSAISKWKFPWNLSQNLSYACSYLYGLFGLNDIKNVWAQVSKTIDARSNMIMSQCAKFLHQFKGRKVGFWISRFEASYFNYTTQIIVVSNLQKAYLLNDITLWNSNFL